MRQALNDGSGVSFAGGTELHRKLARAVMPFEVLGGRQGDVAARQGEAVGLPNRLASDYLGRYREVAHHPSHHRKLLGIQTKLGSPNNVDMTHVRDAIARLETMVLMAGYDLPIRAIRQQVASALDYAHRRGVAARPFAE